MGADILSSGTVGGMIPDRMPLAERIPTIEQIDIELENFFRSLEQTKQPVVVAEHKPPIPGETSIKYKDTERKPAFGD